jgi:hypothetical protein
MRQWLLASASIYQATPPFELGNPRRVLNRRQRRRLTGEPFHPKNQPRFRKIS